MRVKGHKLLYTAVYCDSVETRHEMGGDECYPFYKAVCECGWETREGVSGPWGARSHRAHLVWVERDARTRPTWTMRVVAWIRRRFRADVHPVRATAARR